MGHTQHSLQEPVPSFRKKARPLYSTGSALPQCKAQLSFSSLKAWGGICTTIHVLQQQMQFHQTQQPDSDRGKTERQHGGSNKKKRKRLEFLSCLAVITTSLPIPEAQSLDAKFLPSCQQESHSMFNTSGKNSFAVSISFPKVHLLSWLSPYKSFCLSPNLKHSPGFSFSSCWEFCN